MTAPRSTSSRWRRLLARISAAVVSAHAARVPF